MRALSRAGKRFSAWLLGAVLRRLSRRKVPDRIRRVLVIRVDQRVGNVLLTSPLVVSLQEHLPDAEIQVLVAPSKASILEGVAPTIPFDKKLAWRRPWAMVCALWALRRARFDVAIDAAHWHTFSVTSAALLAWSGAPVRIGHDRGPEHRFANRLVAPPTGSEWEITSKLRLLEPLGIAPGPVKMRTGLGRGAAAERMRAWLAARGIDRPVGLAPGGRKADHRAPVELYAGLGRRARGLGHAAVVLWGPGEEALARAVADACGAVVAPPTSLDELAALMRACAVVVANDTGPMHLSVACEVPTIALFRGADPARWGHAPLGHPVLPVDGLEVEAALAEAEAALARVLDAEPAAAGRP